MEIGDWVRVDSSNGMIAGYVHYIDYYKLYIIQTSPLIKMTKGFQFESMKRSFGHDSVKYEVIMNEGTINDEQIEELINIGLDTRDKEWFLSITAAWKEYKETVESYK